MLATKKNVEMVFVILAAIVAFISVVCYFVFKTYNVIDEASTLRWAFKGTPLICYLLISCLLTDVTSSWKNRTKIFVIVGLFFCIIGDFSLVASGTLPFMIGLGSFLCAHVLNICACSLAPVIDDPPIPVGLIWLIMPAVLLTPAIVLIVLMVINPPLELVYIISVSVYSLVEATSVWRVFARIHYAPNSYTEPLKNQIIAAIGLFLYGISDILLAYDTFYESFSSSYRDLIVLIPYWGGQALFVYGTMTIRKAGEEDDTYIELASTTPVNPQPF